MGDNRWNGRMKSVRARITHAPKNAIDGASRAFKQSLEPLKHDTNEAIESVGDTVRNTKQGLSDFKNYREGIKNAEGFRGKTAAAVKPAWNKAKNTETAKNIKKMIDKIRLVASKVASLAEPLGAATLVISALYFIIFFGISVFQSVTPTPHYYCEVDAGPSLKKTAVWRQYCDDGTGFDLENLNGHYIVQDGSGPCTDCSMANLFMRYFTMQELNFFDYLWKEDGQYGMEGQTLSSSVVATPVTVRQAVNGGSSAATDTTCGSAKYGTANFGAAHGHPITMANWGYLRDESLDLAKYEETSAYYFNNWDNDNWVWDLSLPDRSNGTTWNASWTQTLEIDGYTCITKHIESSDLTGEFIKDLLKGKGDAVPDAGVVLYYAYSVDGNSKHAILLTDYDENTGYWRCVDPAKGVNGGYEGPMDNSKHFAIHDQQINLLLNSGQNKRGVYRIVSITYVDATSMFMSM